MLKLMPMSPFPNIYLVLMAQTILNEWFGLYSSNTRERARCLHSSSLRGFTRQLPIQGRRPLLKFGEKKIEKASSMLFGREYGEIRILTATTFTRCAAA